METVPDSKEIEALLAESEWVGGLALGLVGDVHRAEDLAQETWVAALRRPPEQRDSARPWLATVARNAAKYLRRSEVARRDREIDRAQFTAEKVAASPEDLIARLETQELVSRLVRELPAELSEVILLSYFEGRSLEEIARRRGVPAATIRSRKKRALEVLEERLDARHDGDRSAWLSALVPLAANWSQRGTQVASSAGAVVGTLTPWIAMALSWKTLSFLAALVLLAVSFLNWRGESLEPGTHSPVDRELVQPPVVVASDDLESLESEPPVPERELIAVADDEVENASDAAPVTRIRLRVVDPQGRGVAQAVVSPMPSLEMRDAHREFLEDLNPLRLALIEAEAKRTTDKSGVATWETDLIRISGAIDFDVQGPRYETGTLSAILEPGSDVDLGEVLLEPAGAVRGTVLTLEGNSAGRQIIALAPAELPKTATGLEKLRSSGPLDEVASHASGFDGVFHFEGVPAGEYRAFVTQPGRGAIQWSEPFVVTEGLLTDHVELRVDTAEEGKAEVLVLDWEGKPLTSASISAEGGGRRHQGQVNKSGIWGFAFSYDYFAGGRIEVTDDSLLHRRVTVDPLPRDPQRIVVRMERAEIVERSLRLVDGQGNAVPVANIKILAEGGVRTWEDYEPSQTLILPGGSEGRFRIEVRAPGFATSSLDALSAPALPEDWTIALQPLPGVSGRVSFEGEPLENAKIEMHWRVRAGSLYAKGKHVSLLADRSTASARSAEDGSFQVHQPEDGDFALIVSARGCADAFVDLEGYVASEGRAGIALEMDEGAEVSGTVLDHAGNPVPRAKVVMNHPFHALLKRSADKHGEFRFRRVPSGEWFLRVVNDVDDAFFGWTTEIPEGWQYPANCTVVAGQDLIQDVVLANPESSSISGRVVITGITARSTNLTIESERRSLISGDPFVEAWEATHALSAEGSFAIGLQSGRNYSLAIESTEFESRLRREVEASELPLVMDRHFEFVTLDLQVSQWLEAGVGHDQLYLNWSDGPWRFSRTLAPNDEGVLRAASIPAGTVEVRWKDSAAGEWQFRELNVAPGERRVVEL